MASVQYYIRKYGAEEGRQKYNDFHNQYRAKHRKKMLAYYRQYQKEHKRQPRRRRNKHLLNLPPSPQWTASRRATLGIPTISITKLGINGGRDFIRELVRIRDKRTCQNCRKKWKKGMRRFDVHHEDEFQEGTSSDPLSVRRDKRSFDRMISAGFKPPRRAILYGHQETVFISGVIGSNKNGSL